MFLEYVYSVLQQGVGDVGSKRPLSTRRGPSVFRLLASRLFIKS